MTKLFYFVFERMISSRQNLQTVKRITSGILLVQMDNKKYVKNLIKMKTFNNLKCKSYLHEKLNTSKGVIRNR